MEYLQEVRGIETYSPRYAGEILFHFVGRKSVNDHEKNYETLCKILSQKAITHYPHDLENSVIRYEIDWDNKLSTEKLVVPSVVCFTDIPLESLAIHQTKYGKFGLGFKKGELIRQSTRPVMYVPLRRDDAINGSGASLLAEIEYVLKGFQNQILSLADDVEIRIRLKETVPNTLDDAVHSLKSILIGEFLAFLKPYQSELPDDHVDNYYMEREWRRFGNFPFSWVDTITVARGYRDRLMNDFPTLKCKVVEF